MSDENDRPRIVATIADFAQDGAALIGASLITYGADLIYRPAGFITAGTLLLIGAWLSTRQAAD